MQEKKEYTAIPNCENLPLSLGIPEDRSDEIVGAVRDISTRLVITDNSLNKTSDGAVILLNKTQPQTIEEAFWMGMAFQKTNSWLAKMTESLI